MLKVSSRRRPLVNEYNFFIKSRLNLLTASHFGKQMAWQDIP